MKPPAPTVAVATGTRNARRTNRGIDEYENARMCMCRIDDACTPYRERVRRCVFVSSVANWRCTGRVAADDDEDVCRAAAPYVDALRDVRADETRRRREAYIAVAGFEDVGYSIVLDAVDPDVQ